MIQDLLNYCVGVLLCEWSVSSAASDLPASSARSIYRSKKEFLCMFRRKMPFIEIQSLVCSLLTGVFLLPLQPIVAWGLFWELYKIVNFTKLFLCWFSENEEVSQGSVGFVLPASDLCLPCQGLHFTGLCCVQDVFLLLCRCLAVSPVDSFSAPVALWWIPSELLLVLLSISARKKPISLLFQSPVWVWNTILCSASYKVQLWRSISRKDNI